MTETLRRIPIPGEVIESKHKSAILKETCRVLDVIDGELDRIVVINVEPKRKRGRMYFTGPKVLHLSNVMKDLGLLRLNINKDGVKARSDVLATAEDLDKKYQRKGQQISSARRIREERYEAIRPLVDNPEDSKTLFDPEIRNKLVSDRAHQLKCDKRSFERTRKMIVEILNQYWAGGSVPAALTPFAATMGGRGKARFQKKKLGKKNAPTRKGIEGQEGFVMTEHDKDICGFCWRNYYIRGVTKRKALRRMWREFYSKRETDANGKLIVKLLPAYERPTESQFIRWGKDRSPGHEGWKKQLTKFNLGRLDRPLFGSAKNEVVAVGQWGSTDSTSPDLEFVSVANRADRIGPGHRILVVDGMYGYIAGFYVGLNPASRETVRLAFLHALTDKTEWLRWLSLNDIPPDDWLQVRFANVLADNTDARCEGVIEDLKEIGTGLKFVGVARSDLNSLSEVSHHTLHRLVDHNLHGTTRGQKHERGEERADVLARHTIIEALRETARAVHAYNTMTLDIRPTLEMKRELVDKGIPITRLNLTRWKMNQGKVALSLISNDEARMKLLPEILGVFTQYGVKLLRSDTGAKREFIARIRYVSKHPVIVKKVMKAKVGRRGLPSEAFEDSFLHDPYKPTEIYYKNPEDGELIQLYAVTDDKDLLYECSLHDMIDLMKSEEAYLHYVRAARDEAISNMEAGQEATKQEADDKYQQDMAKLKKVPSRSTIRKNKKENREREKQTYMYGVPIQEPILIESSDDSAEEKPCLEQCAEPAVVVDVSRSVVLTSEKQKQDEAHVDQGLAEQPMPSSIILSALRKRRQEGGEHGKA